MAKNTSITDRLIWLRLKHFGKRGKRAFAKALDIPLSTYASYEAGRTPPADILVKISQITRCNLNWLMTGEDLSGEDSVKEPEISAILGRLEDLIRNQPKAKQAITALIDLLTTSQTETLNSEQSQHTEQKDVMPQAHIKQQRQTVIPIIGPAAAGLPAFWLENDAPITTLKDIVEEFEPERLERQASLQNIYAPDSKEITGDVKVIQLAEPLEHYGLLIDGLIIADSQNSAGKLFAVRIEGDSMIPLITEGDIVIGDTGVKPENGNLALAELNDRIGALCKFYFSDGLNIRLTSSNRIYPTIETTADNIRWIYKVVGKVKKLNK